MRVYLDNVEVDEKRRVSEGMGFLNVMYNFGRWSV